MNYSTSIYINQCKLQICVYISRSHHDVMQGFPNFLSSQHPCLSNFSIALLGQKKYLTLPFIQSLGPNNLQLLSHIHHWQCYHLLQSRDLHFPWKYETFRSAQFGNQWCNVKVFSLSLNPTLFLCSHYNTHWALLHVWAVNFIQHLHNTFALMYYFHSHVHIRKWSVTEFCSNHSISGVDSILGDPTVQGGPQTWRILRSVWGSFGLDSILLAQGSIMHPCYDIQESLH